MRYSGLFVLLLIAAVNIAGWTYLNRPVEPRPWGQLINGVDYSPFQGDQDPSGDKMPSDKDIERDMQLLAGEVGQLRTYSTLDGQGKNAEIGRAEGRGRGLKERLIKAVRVYFKNQNNEKT